MGWLEKRGRRAWPLTLAALAVAAALAVWMSVLSGAARPPPAARRGMPAPGTITTVAGGIRRSGPATRVPLGTGGFICGVSYVRGALYAQDEPAGVVRRIDERTGWLTTPVGGNAMAAWGNRGLAANAVVGGTPNGCSAALDPAGNLLIAGDQDYVVAARTGTFYRRPMTAGHIYPIPGAGGAGMRADRAGNLVTISTADCNGENCGDTPGMVQVLAERSGVFYGMAMRAGRRYTVAGNDDLGPGPAHAGNGGPGPRAALGRLTQLAVDAAGNLLIADDGRTDVLNGPAVPSQIRVVAARDGEFYGQRMRAGYVYAVAGGGHLTAASGVPATRASILALGVALDAAGNVVIGDGGRLRVVAARAGEFYGQRMRAGDIYTVAGTRNSYWGSGDGGPALKARINATSTAVDGTGNLVFTGGYTIRAVAARSGTCYGVAMKAGHIYRIAGTRKAPAPALGGAATQALLPAQPAGVASDSSGDLVIGFTGTGPLFVPARAGTYFGVPMRAGDIYLIPTAASGLGHCPGQVAADRSGNVLIADQARNLVLVAPPRSGTFYGQRMRAGRIYPVAGDGNAAASGDGRPASKAGFSPLAVAADRRGDIIVASQAHVAAPRTGTFYRPAGHIYGDQVRMVPVRSGTFYGQRMLAGHIYTVAGDGSPPARGARIASAVPATRTAMFPFAVAVDGAGNLVLASDYRVRVVAARSGRFYGIAMRAGYIYTIAGPFPGSRYVAVDRDGNILDLDGASAVVRLIAARSGTFYGRQVSAGQVVTVAGRRHAGPAGNTPATQVWLGSPQAIAAGPNGQLLIADPAWDRIGAVSP